MSVSLHICYHTIVWQLTHTRTHTYTHTYAHTHEFGVTLRGPEAEL